MSVPSGTHRDPELIWHAAGGSSSSSAAAQAAEAVEGREGQGDGAVSVGKTRVWGQRSLAKRNAVARQAHRGRCVFCLSVLPV